ncbi:type II toxin-antitoxin system Phd/YefM family antitoxin [Rickettsia australis]|uniref:Antitoxin of toxin-antitoxin system Phd n=1 Tax=Rickettsia australis (strain Cutlack) TaxID=1105110 RepID=H8K7I3_RICAC|nr:type II toxin-antitoxin system Phd/YefM family antitoxin [Rickettsia australis]AFC71226.1 antitoxin of toxin-antitoxin system Phd [Rickettsia australis str. Cutlack]
MTTKIAISQFKSHCLEIIEKLQTNKESIIITKRDREVAQIFHINTKNTSIFGMLKNKAERKADILDPIEDKWNAEH